MIKREIYMSRIRPFIGNELIKVLTGIRRSGKSVMLSLIQEELAQNGVQPEQFISLNFENMSNAHLCTAVALHDESFAEQKKSAARFICSSTKSKRWLIGKNVSTLSGWSWIVIYTLPVPTPSCFPVSLPLILPDGMWSS